MISKRIKYINQQSRIKSPAISRYRTSLKLSITHPFLHTFTQVFKTLHSVMANIAINFSFKVK